MKNFLRFLRPMAYLRRRAIFAGVLGGQRKWLVWGGAAWMFHWIGRIFGGGEPTARYTQELKPGERAFVIHEPTGAVSAKKASKKAARKERKAARRAG